MFIEFLTPTPITINVDMIQYFKPADRGLKTVISMPNCNGSIIVEESYSKVRELIANTRRTK